jgi:hypothetical protein
VVPLYYDRIETENICPAPSCDAWVKACPVGALDGWQAKYSAASRWGMDKRKRYDYMFGTLGGKKL